VVKNKLQESWIESSNVASLLKANRMTAEPRTITLYTDYKSPYAYLAKDPAYALARDCGVCGSTCCPMC
jgi:hypothetical protein